MNQDEDFAATALACEKKWPDAELERHMRRNAEYVVSILAPWNNAAGTAVITHIHQLLDRIRELETLTDKLAQRAAVQS